MKKIICIVSFVLVCITGFSQSNPILKVKGAIPKPLELSGQDLAGLERKSIKLRDKNGVENEYSGVSLLEILRMADAPLRKNLRGKELSKYVLVKCKDDYQVLFSLAELDDSFVDRKVILADSKDGGKLGTEQGPWRLVLEGEKKGARNAYQVMEIIIGEAKP